MVAKHVNKKNAGKPRVLAINALLHSLAALASTFSAVALALILLLGGLPHLETFTWQNPAREGNPV